MGGSAPPHETCQAFDLAGELDDAAIHQFVVGVDPRPRILSQAEAAELLGDPFATRVLLKDTFPNTAGEVLEALKAAATGPNDPLAKPQFFLLGEGSQIPFSPDDPPVSRSLRFLVACGPDLILSAFHPDEGTVELMSWDEKGGGFNYYRTVGRSTAWVFAGNSRHAVSGMSQGKGPFESHKSGAPLMKELRAPWNNWDSPDAKIEPTAFGENDRLADHPWFRDKADLGAFACETEVIRPAIERWATRRFDALSAAGRIDDPRRVMEQVLDTPTVNLVSSKTESTKAAQNAQVGLPATFFVDADTMELLRLPQPPTFFEVPSAIYLQSLDDFQVTLSDGNGFSRRGDTHFAFFVPERAFEDHRVLVDAIRIGLLTERLAAALLMTDFPNPIFSRRRAALLEHVPATATLADGTSDFSERFADAIVGAAADGNPESEFKARWEAGESWREDFAPLLTAYYRAVAERLASQTGFNDYVRLAESRRARVQEMPIAEFPLLFPQVAGEPEDLVMQSDGSVMEA